MELISVEKIKKLAIIAMVSDDYLMENLVLKGGNAIDVIYQISGRASVDLDYSLSTKWPIINSDTIKEKIDNALISTFQSEGYTVFDIKFSEKPENVQYRDELEFWGGYQIEFKIVSSDIYEQYSSKLNRLRILSTIVGPNNKKTFKIDIGKHEYCEGKIEKQIDGYTLFVYSTEMLVLEKIRAICQQVPEYRELVSSHNPAPRARDFFDIFIITQKFPINFNDERILDMLRTIFEVKKVPLIYLSSISEQREFHRGDFFSLKDTVKTDVDLKDFDYYFSYVLDIVNSIKI